MLKDITKMVDSTLTLMLGLVIINVFWGASNIAAREALLQLSAIELVTIRFAIAFIAVFAITLVWKGLSSLRIDIKDVPMFIFLSIVGVSFQYVLQVTSLLYTTVTNFSLLFNLSTFFIIILGAVFLGERLTRRKALGTVISFGGVALIVTGGNIDVSSSHLLGDMIGLTSAALFGVYSIAVKKVTEKYPPATILNYTFFFGTLGMIPFYIFATQMTPLGSINMLSWSSILFLAILCSVVAFLVYGNGLNRLKASDVAITIYISPLAGVVLAFVLLGEAITLSIILGAVLIMAGMYMTQGGTQEASGDGEIKHMVASHLEAE